MPNLENLLSAQIEIKKLENHFGASILELIEFSKKNHKAFEDYCLVIGYKPEPQAEASETSEPQAEASKETPELQLEASETSELQLEASEKTPQIKKAK